MSVRLLCLSAAAGLILAACATSQENPNYQVSTKYKGSNPYVSTTTPSSGNVSSGTVSTVRYSPATTTPASTFQSSTASTQYRTVDQQPVQFRTISAGTGYTQVDQRCLNAEKKRELIGGALGGTIGAVAGKEFIGGTKGTIAGAALGGTLGYGLGDKSINCDPVYTAPQPANVQSYQPTYQAQPGSGQVHTMQTAPNQTYYVPASAPQTASGAGAVGTPGYYAIHGGQPPMQQQAPVQQVPMQQVPMPMQPAPMQQVQMQPQQVYQQHPQTVYVPVTQSQAVTQAAVPGPQFTYAATGAGMHQVVEGDTVYSMSRQLCVGVDDIQRANGLDANYSIKLGQFLQLPASRCVR